MSTSPSSSAALLKRAERVSDPLTRLDRLAEARRTSDDEATAISLAVGRAIRDAREAAFTYPDIAEKLGVSPERARQLGTIGADS